MALIFFGSSRQRISVTEVSVLNFFFFKMLHVIEYAVLYIVVFRGIAWGKRAPDPEDYLLTLLCCFLYAGSDELHQTMVPSREGVLRDVIIDTGGMIIGYLLLRQKFITLSVR
ncbi:MAG: VanZ like family protein [Microgenomates bacterium OLB22]|nr:MAG: VanZ like family protein [Microgenomates bacterium OLB22]